MAGKEKDMSKVKQMLRLHQNGVSNRQIAEELSVNKETVNRYVNLAKTDDLSIRESTKDIAVFDEPPYTGRYVRWCERVEIRLISYLALLD